MNDIFIERIYSHIITNNQQWAKLSHHSPPATPELLPQMSLNPPQSHAINGVSRVSHAIPPRCRSITSPTYPLLSNPQILSGLSTMHPHYTPTQTSYDRSHAFNTSAHPHSLTTDTHAPTRSLPYHTQFWWLKTAHWQHCKQLPLYT